MGVVSVAMAVHFLICSRCDAIGHSAESCPHYRHEREAHADAALGDNVPHMNQVDITIRVNGAMWSSASGRSDGGTITELKYPWTTSTLSWAGPRERVATASSTRSRRFYRRVCSMYLLFGRSWNGVMLGARLPLCEGITSIWPSIGQTSLTSSVGTICKV